MKTQPGKRWTTWLQLLIMVFVPLAYREEYNDAMDEYAGRPLLERIEHGVSIIFKSYRVLAIPAFNKYAFLGEIMLISICLAEAAGSSLIWPQLAMALGPVLIALSLRDIVSYRGWIPRWKTPAVNEYYLDSAADAACAAMTVFLCQGMTVYLTPLLALPAPVLFRFSVVGLPLISTLRMLLRPMPEVPTPFARSDVPMIDRIKQTLWLNGLWWFLFSCTVMLGNSDIHGYTPDKLRGVFASPVILILWIVVQRNGLDRRNKLNTLLRKAGDVTMGPLVEMLAPGLRRGDPFYWTSRFLELAIWGGLAMCLENAVRPWLTARTTNPGFFVTMANLIGFVVCAWTWRYVKKANRETVLAYRVYVKRL